MRIAAISFALLLAAPAPAVAQDRWRPPPPSAAPAPAQPSAPAAAPAPPEQVTADPTPEARPPPLERAAVRPPPPPGSGRPPPSYRSPGYRPWGPGPAYYPSPFWWGWGWGWGYYPLFPYYGEPIPGQAGPPSAPEHHAITSSLRLTGAFGPRDSGAVGLAFMFDGSRGGMDLGFDAMAPNRGGVMGTTGFNGSRDSYGLASAHVAFPVLQGASGRLRLLAGGSWLSVPSSSYGPAADSFGFDVGASANLGLVGPLGLEGHARITPFPVRVYDLRAAIALRAASFSLLGGYRVIDVEADTRTGPAARFEGPEIGFGLVF